MWEKLIAFFMSIFTFIASLFGLNVSDSDYIFKDLTYGSHERQVMDLYLPETNDGEVGLVLFIHGGGWYSGDKSVYKDALNTACNELGYAAAAVNYRYISENTDIHDIMDDIDAALYKIKEVASEKGIVINGVLLTGSSAGGHLSMLYAYSRKSTAPITPSAVVSYCGPTDLTDENFFINNDLGDEEFISLLLSYACGQKFTYEERASAADALRSVSPLYYVDENTVPTVINHGMKDTIVPYSNATSIVEKFDEYGIVYDFNVFPNSNHDLGSDPDNAEIADELMFRYLFMYL